MHRRKNGVLSLGIVVLVLSIVAEVGAIVLMNMTANQIVGEYLQKIAIPAIVVGAILCIIGTIIQLVQNAVHSATRALDRGVERAASRMIDNALSGVLGEAQGTTEEPVELSLSRTAANVHTDLLKDFPGINIDVYKLRAEALVAASYDKQPFDEVKNFLADEYQSQFKNSIHSSSESYVKHQSGLTQYQHAQGTTKRMIFEVTYKLGSDEKKATVTFSNIAQISENGHEKQFCTNCRAPLTALSLQKGYCEYCEVPIFAASDWLCTSVRL